VFEQSDLGFLRFWATPKRTPGRVFVADEGVLLSSNLEDYVWFEDRWMVASVCDEWLTTLCGLILG
jgi:hypothetical protein